MRCQRVPPYVRYGTVSRYPRNPRSSLCDRGGDLAQISCEGGADDQEASLECVLPSAGCGIIYESDSPRLDGSRRVEVRMNLTPFNVFHVFVAGAVWVLMLGYWILVCISFFRALGVY